MTLLPDFLKRYHGHALTRNAVWMAVGQGSNFVLQAGYFLLLARVLGVTEYGVFAGAFALVNIVTPYTPLGSAMLFMRYVSTDHSKANVYWGNGLLLIVCISVCVAALFFVIGPRLTNIHRGLLFAVLVIANCLFAQISMLGSSVFQTFEDMRMTALLGFLSNLVRFLALVVFKICLGRATAFQWSIGVLAASIFAALIALARVRRAVGPLRVDFSLLSRRLWEGCGFSFAGTTQAVYNDVDKTMLSHYGMNRENGFYTLAYRVVDFATTPISAIDAAILPRLFSVSRSSVPNAIRLALKASFPAIALGILAAVMMLVFAPLIPRLVGRDYAGATVALGYLCWIPALRAVHRLAGGVLTGSGRQNGRTVAQFAIALVNFLLNLWWIPTHGWVGAAWSSILSDALLAVVNCAMLVWLWNSFSGRATTNLPGARGDNL